MIAGRPRRPINCLNALKKASVDKSVTSFKYTARVDMQTNTAIYALYGRLPWIRKYTLIRPQKAMPHLENGRKCLTRYAFKFPII